ncbi:MAG: phosphotransferase [Chromatiales bacterium]|nr:phosphotransferase [Chromatiales bacterium]
MNTTPHFPIEAIMPADTAPDADARLTALTQWVRQELKLPTAVLSPLSADASFRRYFRLHLGPQSLVAMDAPPEREKLAAFLTIAGRLQALGLSAPRALARNIERGFALLEDLGDRTYGRALAAGADEATLYRLATDTLIALQQRWQPRLAQDIAVYDETTLLNEAVLLVDWYWPAVARRDCPAEVRAAFLDAWRAVLPAARSLPETLVLRDYHVDNLMLLDGRSGIAACGLLDFQDALIGSPAYDLVSLLRDARRDVSSAIQDEMLARYLDAFPALDRAGFEAAYWTLGAQRTTKIIGIFTRLDRRDGKPAYLEHLPRLWRLLEQELTHPVLAPVKIWFDTHLPPDLRLRPAAASDA